MKKILMSCLVCFMIVIGCVSLVGCKSDYIGPDYFKVFKNLENFRVEYESNSYSSTTYYYTEIKVGSTACSKKDSSSWWIVNKSDGWKKREVFGSGSPFCMYTDFFMMNKKNQTLEYIGETDFCGRPVKEYWKCTNGIKVREYLVDIEYNVVLKCIDGDYFFTATLFVVGGQSIPII